MFDFLIKDISEYGNKEVRELLYHVLGNQHVLLQNQHFIISNQKNMSAQLDALTAQVTTNNDAVQSAITLLGNLKTELDAAIAAQPTDDGAALQALSDSLGTNDAALATAITANTPAAPAPAPTV